jgi:hypothetical protein
MPQPSAPPVDRSTVRRLYFALLGGLVTIMAVFSSLFLLGTAPLIRTEPAPLLALVFATVTMGISLFGWLWARPRLVPRRRQDGVEDYWRLPEAGGRALLLWVLWEGSAMISTVGTLLTGSYLTGTAALLALALMVTHGPGYIEEREQG